MTSRLMTVAVDLVHQIEGLPPAALRRVAAEAASLAVARTQLADPRLGPALGALGAGSVMPSARQAIEQLTEELDERAWDIQELVDAGAASEEAYVEAFRQARAAAAVGYALNPDPQTAAFESVYEAQAAVVDLGAVRMAVAIAITPQP
jgi:hypothetical protein